MALLRRALHDAVHLVHRVVDRLGEVVPGTSTAAGFGTFGAGSCIAFPQATLLNPGSIHVGCDTLIGRNATLAAGYGVHDHAAPERALVVGDRCMLGARVTITAHRSIEIGDDVWFGQGVFVTDASHGYQDPNRPIGLQFGQHQPVRIGAGSWIGHGAIVLPGAVIGRNVVVAAGSVVRGEVEDHAVVAGNPARVVRRLDHTVGWVRDTGAADDVRPLVVGDLLA